MSRETVGDEVRSGDLTVEGTVKTPAVNHPDATSGGLAVDSSGDVLAGAAFATPLTYLHVNSDSRIDAATITDSHDRGTMMLSVQSGGTTGEGEYGPSLVFGGINTTRRRAAIVAKQTSADADQVGLAFLTSPSTTTAVEALSEAVVIDHAGFVGIGIDPTDELTVSGNNPTLRFDDSDTDNNGKIVVDNTAVRIESDPDNSVAGSFITMRVDDTERMRIDSDGAVLIGTTTPGSASTGDLVVNGGVFLGGSAAANELDDYEEGTWTPTFTNLTVGNGTVTTGYTKVGRIVTLSLRIVFGSTTSVSSRIEITGVPFSSQETAAFMGFAFDAGSNNYGLLGWLSSTTIFINALGGALGAGVSTSATMPFTWATNDQIRFTFAYQTS